MNVKRDLLAFMPSKSNAYGLDTIDELIPSLRCLVYIGGQYILKNMIVELPKIIEPIQGEPLQNPKPYTLFIHIEGKLPTSLYNHPCH